MCECKIVYFYGVCTVCCGFVVKGEYGLHEIRGLPDFNNIELYVCVHLGGISIGEVDMLEMTWHFSL